MTMAMESNPTNAVGGSGNRGYSAEVLPPVGRNNVPLQGDAATVATFSRLFPATPAGVDVLPSADQLLLLFARSSDSHNLTEQAVKERIQQAIDGKNGLTSLSSDLQALAYHKDGDVDVTSAKPVIDKIDALLKTEKDPTTRSALESARTIAVMGPAAGQTDDVLTKDDVKKIDTIMS